MSSEFGSNEEEQILAYGKMQGLFHWVDLEKEFTKTRGWSKGKFINHWKRVRDCFDRSVKDPKTGRRMYLLAEQYQGSGTKALLKIDITQGDLNEIRIPLSRLEKVADYIIEKISGQIMLNAAETADSEMKKAEEGKGQVFHEASIVAFKKMEADINDRENQIPRPVAAKIMERLKLKDAPLENERFTLAIAKTMYPILWEALTKESEVKSRLMQVLKLVRIQLLCDPSETAPLLTDNDIAHIINAIAPKLVDENKGKLREKPFHLIISFPVTPEPQRKSVLADDQA